MFELDALNARNESEKLKKELSSNRPLQATRSLSFLQMVDHRGFTRHFPFRDPR